MLVNSDLHSVYKIISIFNYTMNFTVTPKGLNRHLRLSRKISNFVILIADLVLKYIKYKLKLYTLKSIIKLTKVFIIVYKQDNYP